MLKRRLSKVAAISLLAVLIILSMLSLIGCEKRPNRIGAPIVISPSGQELAIKVGPQRQIGSYIGLKASETQAYVIKIGKSIPQIMSVLHSRGAPTMAWRPSTSPPELFVAAFPVSVSNANRIFAVKVSDVVSTVFSEVLPSDLLLSSMYWNPNGQILAAKVIKLGLYELSGIYLGISYDNGKNIVVTNISISNTRLVWTNNETLYVQDENDISELSVGGRSPPIKRTFFSAEGVFLAGSLDGKVVYFLGNEIYCGSQLLYNSNQKIRQVVADGSYLAFKADNHVWVLDGKGNVKNKKNLGQDVELMALCSARKFVYLVKNYQYIQRYSFVDDDEISTVFDVGILK